MIDFYLRNKDINRILIVIITERKPSNSCCAERGFRFAITDAARLVGGKSELGCYLLLEEMLVNIISDDNGNHIHGDRNKDTNHHITSPRQVFC